MVTLAARRSLGDRFRLWQARRVANPGFRARAARSPLTGWVARRYARRLFGLCAGFVHSQVLTAVVRLGIVERLAAGPCNVDELADAAGIAPDAADRLVAAAADLGLVARLRDGACILGPLGAALAANPSVAAMIAHHDTLYRDLADPVALLRAPRGSGALAAYWPYAGNPDAAALPPDRVSAYCGTMASSVPLVADDLLRALDPRRFRRLLDVGGGDGSFALAAARGAPGLEVVVFDLPAVAARAEARFAAAGLGSRGRVVGGDFRRDPLPPGADLVTLLRVLHDHDDDDALALLRSVHAALAPGGTVTVAEPLAGTPGAQGVGAYFSFYLLAMGRGRPRTPGEVRALLGAAGFRGARQLPMPLPVQAGVIVARR
jgi:demethylspheroidene O-methyltransferase